MQEQQTTENQNELFPQSEVSKSQIKFISYLPWVYRWYITMESGDVINVKNDEIAIILRDFVNYNPEETVIQVLGDDGLSIIFKIQDKIQVAKIEEVEKKIRENKNRIQELELMENEVRQNAVINMDNGKLDALIPINRERTRLIDDNDVLLKEIQYLKRIK